MLSQKGKEGVVGQESMTPNDGVSCPFSLQFLRLGQFCLKPEAPSLLQREKVTKKLSDNN